MPGLVSWELRLGFRDRALRSRKKGNAWLVCYYWPTDVKVSVTCLVKRKKFECKGERGLLCNQLHQWLIIISNERDKLTHWGTLQASHSPHLSLIFPSFLILLLFFLRLLHFIFWFSSQCSNAIFVFSVSPHLSPFLSYLYIWSCFKVSSTSPLSLGVSVTCMNFSILLLWRV